MDKSSKCQNGFDNCAICKWSTRAHSLKESSRYIWANVCRRSKTVYDSAAQRISRGAHKFEVKFPKTAACLKNAGGKIHSTVVFASVHLGKAYNRIAGPVKGAFSKVATTLRDGGHARTSKHALCIGSALLLYAAFLYYIMGGDEFVEWLLTVGVFLAFLSIYGLVVFLRRRRAHGSQLSFEECSRVEVPATKPPEYESLLPGLSSSENIPPPVYEDVYHNGGAVCIGEPICSVHQFLITPQTSVLDTRTQEITPKELLVIKSKSLNNFCENDQQQMLNSV